MGVTPPFFRFFSFGKQGTFPSLPFYIPFLSKKRYLPLFSAETTFSSELQISSLITSLFRVTIVTSPPPKGGRIEHLFY